MKKIAILEPGAWGTTLGILLSKKNGVNFWYENAKLALKVAKSKKNERLSGVKLPQKIHIYSDLEKTLEQTDLVIIASPSFNLRKVLLKLKKIGNLPPLLGIAKGIEKETLKVPSQIVKEILGDIPYAHLSGPGFAREIIRGKPAPEVIAAKDKHLLKKLKEIFKIRLLQVSVTTDLIGVQLAGALKNALSIGMGLVRAKYPQSDIKKKLISLGLREMMKLGKSLGAKKETLLGPAGLGDLILSSSDSLSRNFRFGQALFSDAEKMRKEIKERKITVEGFDNIFALYQLGKIKKLNLPIINETYKVIYEKFLSRKAVENLVKLTKKV